MLKSFPNVRTTSPSFVASAICCIVSQIAWFQYLRYNYYPFEEVCAFFIILVWLVPFIYFISISSNDTALPYGATISASTIYSSLDRRFQFQINFHPLVQIWSRCLFEICSFRVFLTFLFDLEAGEVVEGDKGRHNFIHNIGQTLLGFVRRDNGSLDTRMKYHWKIAETPTCNYKLEGNCPLNIKKQNIYKRGFFTLVEIFTRGKRTLERFKRG